MAIHSASRTDVNRSAILAQLGAHGPASRADLARALGVSPALITQLTKDLLTDGLLAELENSPSQGGRPARMLGLAASAGRAIGVKVVADHVAFVEVGIDGTVVRSAIEPYDASAPTFLADLAGLLDRFIETGDGSRLLGVGVGVPGAVDEQARGMVDSWTLGWTQVPLGAALQRGLGLPVLIENNVNALAMAERLYGVGRDHQTFLVVTIGTGVGAAIVMDGMVMRGGAGGAGELGHVPVEPAGEACSCGNHGCLETIVGQGAIERRARAAGILPDGGDIAALTAIADDGDARARQLFADAGGVLAIQLAGLVQVLDPEAVIVLGEGTAAWAHWAPGFESAFREHLLPSRRGVPVIVESWTDESWAQGAASLVLSTPFDSEGVSGEQGRLVRSRLSGAAPAEAGRGR